MTMPGQTGKAAGFSFKAATLKHRDNEVQEPQDFSELPGGISGAIAKLKDMKFGKYKSGPNQGKDFFYAAGIVQSPRTAIKVTKTWQDDPKSPKGGRVVTVGTPVEVVISGQRTSIMIPLCDTKGRDRDGNEKVTPGGDHLADMVNELKLLNEDSFAEHIGALEETATEAQVRAAYEALFADLCEQGIRFRFSTREGDPSKKYPTPRVFHTWAGSKGIEDEPPQDVTAGVEDDGQPQEEGGGDEPPEPAADAGGDLPEDLDELAVIAADDDHPQSAGAMDRIVTMAEEAGIDTADGSDFHGASIEDGVQMIKDALAPQDEEPAAEEWTPAKGDPCFAKLPSTKDPKKLMPKRSQVEILSINEKAGTCTLKNGVTGKTVLGADKKPRVYKLSDLSQEDE